MPLPIYEVPDDPPRRQEENLGSKAKFWLLRDGEEWLFKQARDGSGEDWAEIVAAQCADQLGLPHAHYELATWQGQRGVVSRKLHPEGTALVFGNQLLAEQDPGYPASVESRFVRTTQHTLDAIAVALGGGRISLPVGWTPRAGITSALDVFGGYLLLDAWIANTDRHHLNWGVIESTGDHVRSLAPTYDHAASLGASLTDDERRKRLSSRDSLYAVAAYVSRRRVRSALFRRSSDTHPLPPLEAFLEWRRLCPAARAWSEALDAVDDTTLAGEIAAVPESRMSAPARRFALEILRCNKRRILEADAP